MSDKSVKIFVRNSEFCEWYNRAKERGAKIIANGMTGMIVITENRYFTVVVK